MRLLLWLAFLVATVVVLGGCREDFQISVTQTPNMAPKFHLRPSSGAEDEGVEINNFSVLFVADPRLPSEQLWVIETKSKTPIKMKEITYGIVPAGFEEWVPPHPLVAGKTYAIMSGMPGKIGGAGFQVTN